MVTDLHSPPPSDAAEAYGIYAPAQLTANKEPKRVARPTFVYRRSVLPLEGGRVLLRLNQPPVVEVNPETLECEVQGWDVRLPHDQIENIDRRMARRFLELFSKAQARILSHREEAAWLRVLEHVDYAGFSHDRAAPHYVEGTLLRRTPHCRVEWNDGAIEAIAPHVANALDILNAGDRFGAYVKISTAGKALAIERVVLIHDANENVG